MTYTSANILETYADCAECNRLCYRLVDCETLEVTHYSEDVSWSTYVGKVLRWQTETIIAEHIAAGTPIEYNCSVVETYICRLGNYEVEIPADLSINSCFRTCEECTPFDPVPEEEEILTGRTVAPGRNVPDCHRGPKTCNS